MSLWTGLKTAARRFTLAFAASTGSGDRNDDGCVASCVDPSDDARPIVAGDRLFALLGYELIERHEGGGQVGESAAPASRRKRPGRRRANEPATNRVLSSAA